MHSRHIPAWDFYGDWMNYVARLQWVARSGVPKLDVAFYQKRTSYTSVPVSYNETDLQDAGYTYEYISPDDFYLPAAKVVNKLLAPTAQAFQVIVVRSTEPMTALGLTKLNQWAAAGLPIVFAGGLPTNFSDLYPTTIRTARAQLQQLSRSPNAHKVPSTNLAASIAQLGIRPRVALDSLSSSLTTWYPRVWQASSKMYALLYNDATGAAPGEGNATRTITFAATGVPYLYDAWTGAQTAISNYQQANGYTKLTLSLSAHQTALIVFDQSRRPGNDYSSSNPPSHKTFSAPINLTDWTLTVEAWTPPSDLFDINGTVKTNQTYHITELVPWNELTIANLSHVSGRGYYRTSFTLPSSNSHSRKLSAIIDLGAIVHTAVAYINGARLPPLDVTHAVADISPFLKSGKNDVEVVVATPFGNALIPVWFQLLTAGRAATVPPTPAAYGLVNDVLVIPYTSS
jgi:hypothetical protein